MLKPLRRKTVIKVTMWVLIATFVIWGVGSMTMTTRANYAGIIFGKKVSPQEFSKSYSAIFTRAKIQYGDNLSKMQKFLNLESQAWDRLIILYYAKKKRTGAGNKEVIEKIAQMPFFQTGGAFDPKSYNYIVQNVFGTTAREFEETVRQDIIISKLMDSAQKGITASDKEIEDAYKTRNEKADISYILITSDTFKNESVYKEDELLPFYNTHKEQFRTQEKRNIYYVKIAFVEKEGQSQDKEKTKALAQEINDYLNLGEDFNVLAKKYNLTVEETGPFQFGLAIPKLGLLYPFSIASFSVSKERPNSIVEDAAAFYVIKLKEIIEPAIPTFEQAREDVKNALMASKQDELAKHASKNYFALLKDKKDTLEALATRINVKIANAKDITRQGYIDNIGPNAEFSSACFSIVEGELAGPVKVQNGYAIIRLDKLKPMDKEKFEKEKLTFKNTLLEEKKQKAFYDWFSDLKTKANLKVIKIGAGAD